MNLLLESIQDNAVDTLDVVCELIDRRFGAGASHKHPELVGALLGYFAQASAAEGLRDELSTLKVTLAMEVENLARTVRESREPVPAF